VELGREVLDQQLVDRSGINMGKVDGVVLELREDGPPRISAILTGGHLLARRLHPRLESLARWLTRRYGPGQMEPMRISWEKVMKIGVDVKVDMEAQEGSPWEHWVRDHILSRIPGA
jgi:sporulation protein YlmC with PRC-barrel domain